MNCKCTLIEMIYNKTQNFSKNKTFLRSFVAGNANFCNHLLSSLVHFTVVKSQAILIIHLVACAAAGHDNYF